MLIGLLAGLIVGFIFGLACAIAIVTVAGHDWRGIVHDWGIELISRRYKEEVERPAQIISELLAIPSENADGATEQLVDALRKELWGASSG